MVFSSALATKVDESVAALPLAERERLTRYGALVLARETESRLELAKRKLAEFEKKYGMTLARLNKVGLPDNAGLEAHEDYVEWSGWQSTHDEASEVLANLQAILEATGATYSA
jgi:hypothetical protein